MQVLLQKKIYWVIPFIGLCLLIAWQFDSDPNRWYLRGLSAVADRDRETVLREASRLRKATGFESYGHMLRGKWFLSSQAFAAAAAEFQLAARNTSLRTEALTRCGEAFYRMQRFLDAENVLLQALESEPSNSDARRWLASTYYDLGAMTSALEHLKIIGSDNPTDGRPYRLRGLIQKDFEQYDQAIPEYEMALTRELPATEREAVLLELSECLVRQLRFEDALKTLKVASQTSKSQSIEAQCYAALGRPDDAERLADEAIQLDPSNVAAILTKARILIENGQAEKVLPTLRTTAEKHPGNYDVLFQLVKALRLTGNSVEADAMEPRLSELNRLIDEFSALHLKAFNDVGNADLRFQIAQIAMKLDRPKLARIWLQAALAIDATHTASRDLLDSLPALLPDEIEE